MQSTTMAVPATNKAVWAGRVISALAVLFMIFDGVIKLIGIDPVVQSFELIGYSPDLAFGIGVLALVCVAAHVIPRTSWLGAILLTGYLGSAIASHVRVGSELFSLVFPIMIGAMLWGGLWLRDQRLRAFTKAI